MDAVSVKNDKIIVIGPRMIEASFPNGVAKLDPESETL
jgi:hypothetical protein